MIKGASHNIAAYDLEQGAKLLEIIRVGCIGCYFIILNPNVLVTASLLS